MDAMGDEKSIWDGCYKVRGKHILLMLDSLSKGGKIYFGRLSIM